MISILPNGNHGILSFLYHYTVFGRFCQPVCPALLIFPQFFRITGDADDRFLQFAHPRRVRTADVIPAALAEGVPRNDGDLLLFQKPFDELLARESRGLHRRKGIERPARLKAGEPDVVEGLLMECCCDAPSLADSLDEIEEGKESENQAMNDFYFPFIEKFQEVEKTMYKDPDQETGEMCPVCGSPLVIKKSRYGSFVACSNYPKCRYIKREAKEKPAETGEMCPVCGKPLVVRHDKRGKEFIACSGFPKCTYIKGKEEKAKPVYTEQDYVKPCPSCGSGHLVVKHGRRVDFLGCTNFPKCRYHEWLTSKKGRDGKGE